MDNNSNNAGNPGGNNRLYLNFGQDASRFQGTDRAYPTTPSTFPNPIYPSGGSQQTPTQQPYNTGNAPQGYFMNNQYPPNYPQQQQASASYQQQQQQQYAYQQQHQQQRLPPQHSADATSGLVHQFSNQNLGNGARPGYGQRGTSSSPRPRTAGAPGQQQPGYSYLNAQMPSHQAWPEFQPAPARDPDRYSSTAGHNQKKCAQMAADLFKDSVKRARDRNLRQSELHAKLAESEQSQTRREQIWSNAGKLEAKYLRFLRTKESPTNYNTIKIIGKGAFGEVKLVQKKEDGKVYAMKSLVKAEMFKRDQLAHVRAERDILAEADSPWVVKLYNTFQDPYFLYMLMEFLPGGDLMTMLIKYEIFSEDITRFYIAEIVLAIEAVHKLGFIHRDIKPDNILLDKGGHVKLTDFGLSTGFHKLHDNSYYAQLLNTKKEPSSKTRDRNSVNLDQINLTVSNRSVINDWRKSRRTMAYSTVGTPDYIAPEIFSGQGYSYDCDWWSLGTIMFECQVGWPPFCAEDVHDTYRKIVNWRSTLYFPEDVQLGPEAENLIRSLVCNAENRLGRVDAQEIKNHKFFRGVDFDKLRTIRAPFEPKLTSNIDVTYFPIDEIDQTDNATHLLREQGNSKPQREDNPEMSLPFLGYTFKRFETTHR